MNSPFKLLDQPLDSPAPNEGEIIAKAYQAMRQHLNEKGYEYHLFNQHYWLAHLDKEHKRALQDYLDKISSHSSESLILSARLLGRDFVRKHANLFKKYIPEAPDFQAFELAFALHSNRVIYKLDLLEAIFEREALPSLLRSYLGQLLLETWFTAEIRQPEKTGAHKSLGDLDSAAFLTNHLEDYPGYFKNFAEKCPELRPLQIYLENLRARKLSLKQTIDQAPALDGFLPSAFFRPLRPLLQMRSAAKSDLILPFKPLWRHRPMGRQAIIVSFDWAYWQRYSHAFLSSLSDHGSGSILHLIPVDFGFSDTDLGRLEKDYNLKINVSQFDGDKAVDTVIARGVAPQRRKIIISLAAFARYLHLPDLLAFYNLISISDLDGRWAAGSGASLSRPGLGLCYSPDKEPATPHSMPWQVFHAGRMALRGGAMTSGGGEEKLSQHIKELLLKALDCKTSGLDLWYSDQIAIAAAIGEALTPASPNEEKLNFRFDQILFEQIWPKPLAPVRA